MERVFAVLARNGVSHPTRGLQNLFFKHWSWAASTSLFDFTHPFYSSMLAASIVSMSLWLVWNVWQRQISTKRSSPSWAKWKRCDLARDDSLPKRLWFGIIMLSIFAVYLSVGLSAGNLVHNVPLHPSSHNLFVGHVWDDFNCWEIHMHLTWSKLRIRVQANPDNGLRSVGCVPHHWPNTTAIGHHPQTSCRCGL